MWWPDEYNDIAIGGGIILSFVLMFVIIVCTSKREQNYDEVLDRSVSGGMSTLTGGMSTLRTTKYTTLV
jgi:hypothetical protein